MSATPNVFDRFIRYRLVSHTSFWIAVVVVLSYHGSLFGGTFRDNLINMVALIPAQMVAAYFLNYVQIPNWLYKGYYFRFLFSLLIIGYLLAAMARLSVIYFAEPIIGIESLDESFGEILSDPIFLIRVYAASVYIPALLLFLIKMTKDRFVQEQRLVILEKEKRTTELDFLKAQMNPHFLFNTLNNLYALAKRDSDKTPEMILKLSEILDYTIYEGTESTVPIVKEWELIENYVDLETLRYSDQLVIVLDKKIDNSNARIAPLILISLVENAFKYSLKQLKGVPSIKISLKVVQNTLTFEVFNTKVEKRKEEIEDKRGIGVQNVKRQLELQYPKRHSIDITDEKDTYKVNLMIQLPES